ncbi:Ppx/GppA phosphatase family protein [Nonomuraea jiangxiensis]|uniref:Exopolyphosphatase / guanosine-5'-triphosphate,3'-diphosphate pyrophosphatase n=1 Tax=Nonomuraea jiangxiensis TaxID=633440 RepID=A0A1G8K6W2_9ACTN|nr:Ppx/GppA phosphatase family protein [Nonomuraea jiangxiensis]SDI38540.1 exopolyphosphatase / guanosine-5'-triphosphate,3'-diphosphate pyrophosphatase [Nonomuraea jiangxiensis]
MRLGVLDIGSNTVHLLVVDAHRGARPMPAYSNKIDLRLTEYLDAENRLARDGVTRLGEFVEEAMRLAEDKGVEEVLAFATSAVREAANGEQVLAEIDARCGVHIEVLSGRDEARLTFLAVRRWFGWSSGRLLAFDIGGGSLEIAAGVDEEPDVAASLPLGAGRLTRDWFTGDPPTAEEIRRLRKHVRTEIARTVGGIARYGEANRAVATSKTFKQLARIAGAAPSNDGPYVSRSLSRQDMADWAVKLTTMGSAERAQLPGVSEGRAAQLAAGALVADAAMDLFEVDRLDVCPWALREGVILRRLDILPGRLERLGGGPE